MIIAFHNLGCRVNTYELNKIKEALLSNGFVETSFDTYADIYVVNTCSVTHIADRKSRNMLRRAKKINPNAIVIAVGCFVNAMSDEDKNKLKNDVDIFVRNEEKKDILNIICEYIKTNNKQELCNDKIEESNFSSNNFEIDENSINNIDIKETGVGENNRIRKFIKIQDGCNMYCTYCIIPYLRPNLVDRSIEDVENEVLREVKNGVKEIVLTGIHISSYKNLCELIEKIALIPEVLRIRLGSLEPRLITEKFVEFLLKDEVKNKFCFEFHLSLQSGSNTVLKRMNRHYTKEDYENACSIIRRNIPNALISTDIIVGFPGETEEEFNETIDFVKKIEFYNPHIFIYSKRRGTKAEKMPNQVDENIKIKREKILIEIANEISDKIRNSLLGQKKSILIEEVVNGKSIGFTREYVKSIIEKPVKIGEEVDVKLSKNEKDFVLALID